MRGATLVFFPSVRSVWSGPRAEPRVGAVGGRRVLCPVCWGGLQGWGGSEAFPKRASELKQEGLQRLAAPGLSWKDQVVSVPSEPGRRWDGISRRGAASLSPAPRASPLPAPLPDAFHLPLSSRQTPPAGKPCLKTTADPRPSPAPTASRHVLSQLGSARSSGPPPGTTAAQRWHLATGTTCPHHTHPSSTLQTAPATLALQLPSAQQQSPTTHRTQALTSACDPLPTCPQRGTEPQSTALPPAQEGQKVTDVQVGTWEGK